ncbi:major facilitator transporter [Luteipulveratus mongoliensis]|uniref:Major facilitator transporter n=2 Tax=Luteipulveratus mongoliensis TaxID=571913 RepID=A0A0K1JNW3_9MICO|nr:major facilitator transporter [Luteipulveratus mongoliensis]
MRSARTASSATSTRLLLPVLCGSTFMASLDLFVVNVAVDDIGRSFAGSSLGDVSWIINAYAIVYAALLIPAGRWADRVGRKTGFLVGVGLFTVASVACAVSPALWFLVGARCLQAVGAAIMTPASLGLLIVSVPADKRAGAIRLWATTSALAAAAGPVLGGLLVQLSWQWIFVINLPVGIALILLGRSVIQEFRRSESEPMDAFGAVLLALAVGLLAVAIVQGPDWGWGSASVVGTFVAAVLASAVLVWHTRRAEDPIVAPALLRIPSFSRANLAMVTFNVAFAAGLLPTILFMQTAWGYDALRAGLAVAPGPFVVPIFAQLGGRLAPRLRAPRVAALGCLLWAGGLALVALSIGDQPSYAAQILPGWLLAGAGVGLTLPMIVGVATASLPPEWSATGGAIVNVARQIGTVLGVSLVVALLASSSDSGTPHEAFARVLWVSAAASVVAMLVSLVMVRRPASGPAAPAC